jgi:hypothetical protein
MLHYRDKTKYDGYHKIIHDNDHWSIHSAQDAILLGQYYNADCFMIEASHVPEEPLQVNDQRVIFNFYRKVYCSCVRGVSVITCGCHKHTSVDRKHPVNCNNLCGQAQLPLVTAATGIPEAEQE